MFVWQQVEHAMETPYSFSHIVLAHYKRQAFAQARSRPLFNYLFGWVYRQTDARSRPSIDRRPSSSLSPHRQNHQILTIAGSLSTLGSPVDLVTSVGTGVKDFFYEPINGLVHSPKVRPSFVLVSVSPRPRGAMYERVLL